MSHVSHSLADKLCKRVSETEFQDVLTMLEIAGIESHKIHIEGFGDDRRITSELYICGRIYSGPMFGNITKILIVRDKSYAVVNVKNLRKYCGVEFVGGYRDVIRPLVNRYDYYLVMDPIDTG